MKIFIKGQEIALKNDLSTVYKYKGSVANEASLPTENNAVGDVYNCEDTGNNFAWTGTAWDKLAGTVDMSNYYTKAQADANATSIANARAAAIADEKIAAIPVNNLLHYKGHRATINDLPSTGQPTGPINSGFNLDNCFKDVILNPVIPSREPETRAILKDFDPTSGPNCAYYVAFLQKYDSYYTKVYAECLKTDYPEQLKFVSGLSVNGEWDCDNAVVVLYDANKPVYRRYRDDSWELVTKTASYLVVGNHLRLNTQLKTPKDSDGNSGTFYEAGTGRKSSTALSTLNKGYSDATGTRYYYDQDYIIIVPGADSDYGVIYTGGSQVVENDVYTVGENRDIYRGNAATSQWEQWSQGVSKEYVDSIVGGVNTELENIINGE